VLQAVNGSPTSNAGSVAGNPIALTSDSKSQFLFVANAGPSAALGQANSDITLYSISSSTGVLAPGVKPSYTTGSGPQCIIEDPSNQYIYTADYNGNTVTGHVLNPNTGDLTPLRNMTTFPTVGNPTWCVADAHTF
jgi:6-phosphogluconolactonase (cycloisomerase 2 family)